MAGKANEEGYKIRCIDSRQQEAKERVVVKKKKPVTRGRQEKQTPGWSMAETRRKGECKIRIKVGEQ